MDRTFMFVGALMGFVGVGLGAFGAHALRGRLSPEMLAIFETAVRYQMYHAIALLAVAAMMSRVDGRSVVIAGWSFIVGILIFSGSLYALALTGVTMLGAITPLGGLALLAGCVALAKRRSGASIASELASPGALQEPSQASWALASAAPAGTQSSHC